MHNKRPRSCELYNDVLERNRRASRLLQRVARMKWYQRTVWQMAELCGSVPFLSLTSRRPSFSITCSETSSRQRNTLQCQIPSFIASVHFTTQKKAFS